MWTTVAFGLVSAMAFFTPTQSEGNGASLAPGISEFKMDLHRMLEGSRIRKKRQLQTSTELSDYKLRFGSITSENLPYLSDYNLTFWIPVFHEQKIQVLVGTTQGHLLLFQLSDKDDKTAMTVAISEDEDIALKAKAFSHYDEQWFSVLHSSGGKYYIRMYERVGRGLERRQMIALTGASDMELVTMNGINYLVVVTYSSTTSQGFTYRSSVVLYQWTTTQFDVIAHRDSFGARSIACWVLGGSLYLAVAQEVNDEMHYEVGSPVFFYNSKEENRLVLWDMLSTFGPTKIQHFYVGGSHYVVVIGRQDAVIYWWSSGQFLLWQTIPGTAFASDLSVLVLRDGEVAIVIGLKEIALFYTLDASGNYILTSSLSFKGSSLTSLQFIFSRQSYFALALFAEATKQSIWRLTLASHYLPPISLLDTLQQCLKDALEYLNVRETELGAIKADLKRVWLKESNQTIASKVVVNGTIASRQEMKTKDVITIKHAKLPDSSLSLVIAAFVDATDSLDGVKNEMAQAVYKSSRQEIRGTKYFTDNVYIPSLTMDTVDGATSINDVLLSRLQTSSLKKVGNQVFPYTTLISNVYTESANIGTLNGISTDDLLLLNGEQVVTGNLKFSNVQAKNALTNSINSIPMNELVTTHSNKIIKDLKVFSQLELEVLDVRGETNGVDLGDVAHKIATIDGNNDFQARLTFINPLILDGSLFLMGKVNKIFDLSRLLSHGVTRDAQQDLTGLYKFKSGAIFNDLLIAGSFNGISTDNLLSLSSDQKVYADMSFSAPLTIASDITVDTVNGIDLNEEVLTRIPDNQFLTGRKIFAQNIVTDFVDMTDYVTLDNVDPSLLVQDIVKHKQGVVSSNSTVFKDVVVLGNVTALGGVNGYEVLDLPNSVWLKDIDQTIYTPIKANFLHFKNDLDVHLVNNFSLDSDFVTSFKDEEIISSKVFHHKIEIKRGLKVNDGTTINGIDPKIFRIQLENYEKEGAVHGIKTFGSLDIKGDLRVEMLNDGAGIMQPDVPQTVEGPVEFESEITAVLGNAKMDKLSFGAFNGQKLEDYFRRAVLKSTIAKSAWNKDFSHLEALNLSVPNDGRIGGVSLNDMLRHVVTLNTPQLVTSPKSFASANFAKHISVFLLNGLDVTSFIGDVVLTDEVLKVSNKQFLGNIKASNAFVRGMINGIKIEDLAENVFYKSEDNEVTEPFLFKNDVDIENLLTNSFLDGVEWNSMIFLRQDEVLGPAWFLSNIHANGDVFITGLLNGCNLTEVAEKSIHREKSSQVIAEHLNVQNIVVEGNVVINDVNKISLEIIKNVITTSGDQIIPSDVVIDGSLTVNTLHINESVNSKAIEIMRDAVRHSVPQQVIGGRKVFKKNLYASVLTGGNIFAHKVDGVVLEELYITTVWKNGYREIEGDKIFPLLFTNVATVKGRLNGLRFPEDVVLTYTSEHIGYPTYLMSDVYVTSDLAIHGLIDGVDIRSLILNRVTLSGEQNVSAQLTFKDDFVLHDELTIEGTINEIVLELVAKVRSIHPLHGYKVFIEMYVSGPLSASSVNGYNLQVLADNIARYNKDDYINEVQVFEKSMHAQNLFVEWINGVSLRKLIDTFNFLVHTLGTTLAYLEDFSFSLQQMLSRQLSVSQGKVSTFAYFVLFQEIDMGPTSRILGGYKLDQVQSEFSHSMVMWTTQKQCVFMEKCCHLYFSYWLRVKKDGVIMVDGASESGKYYPIHDPAQMTYNSPNFFMWTNSTEVQPKWCDEENQRMFLASYNNEGLLDVFVDVDGSPLLNGMKTFRKGHLYLVAGFYYDTKRDEYSTTVVYVFDDYLKHWTEHQILPSFGVFSLDVISYHKGHNDEILLAAGTGMDTLPSSYSTVYRWNNKDQAFEVLQNIPSRHVTSTLWIVKGKDLVLSMAGVDNWPSKNVDCSETISGGEINIYLYEKKLRWIQSIPLGGVISIATFSVDGDTFLAAASSQHQAVYIYEWKGYAAFVQVQKIFVGDVKHISIYTIDDDTYMTVALTSGPSKILKMVRRGDHSMSRSFNPTSLEQKDEVPKEIKLIRGC